jgi:LPXTG-motif cell wall-anchored protein
LKSIRRKEDKNMKKMILSTLFSATLLMGATGTFADTITPDEPTTPPSGEVTPPTDGGDQPTDPVLPPVTGDSGTGGDTGTTTPPDTGDSGIMTPPATGDSNTGGNTGTTPPPDTGDTGTTTPPATGDSNTGGDTGTTTPPDTGDTGTTTPPVTGDSNTGGDTGTTTPPNTENSGTGETKPSETVKPVNPAPKPTPTPPAQNVVVKPDGTIGGATQAGVGTSSDGSQIVPIVTNDIHELTNIPTPMTPVETNTGERIVSVKDGIAYKQADDGSLTPVTAEVKQLPSGNVAVKGADGKMKILPKTGEKATSAIVTLIGGILTSVSGWFFWKKRRV